VSHNARACVRACARSVWQRTARTQVITQSAMLAELLQSSTELTYERLIALDATIQRSGLDWAIVQTFERRRHHVAMASARGHAGGAGVAAPHPGGGGGGGGGGGRPGPKVDGDAADDEREPPALPHAIVGESAGIPGGAPATGAGSGGGHHHSPAALLDEEEPCCPICLEVYGEGEWLKTLPCQHCFHEDCILRWFKDSKHCPMCRFDCEKLQPAGQQ
jgi:hypothetical protein